MGEVGPGSSRRLGSDLGETTVGGSTMRGGSSESVYEQSTLVVEIVTNTVKKYYLIPPGMTRNNRAKKIMKKGLKLHIFNEHTFVATHAPAGTRCNNCMRNIPRSFGKQAYQCRDCRLICHKRCHFKFDSRCLNSKVSQLEMQYLWNEEGR